MLLKIFCLIFIVLKGSDVCGGVPPDKNAWKECDIENGHLALGNDCKRHLICYESKLNAKNGNLKVGRRFKVPKGDERLADECTRNDDGSQFQNWNALRISEHGDGNDSTLLMESSLILEMKSNFGFSKEPKKHLNISKAIANVFPFAEEFKQMISLGAFLEDYDDLAIRLIALELLHSATMKNETKRCKTKCALLPTASFVHHQRTKCTEISFPADIALFMLNVTVSPYELVCRPFHKQYKLPPPNFANVDRHDSVNACNQVPTKCERPYELYGCFKHSQLLLNANSTDAFKIATKCQSHFPTLSAAEVAGFRVQMCAHREAETQLLIFVSTVVFSFSDKIFQTTKHFSVTFEKITEMKEKMPIFVIEFGDKKHESVVIHAQNVSDTEWKDNEKNDFANVLWSITPQVINGSVAKQLHLIPPATAEKTDRNVDEYIYIFFQIPSLRFSQRIAQRALKRYENDANKTKPTVCDLLEDDCEPTRALVNKIMEYAKRCDPSNPGDPCIRRSAANESASQFTIPPWRKRSNKTNPTLNAHIEDPLERPDIIWTKERAQRNYNKYKKTCAICMKDPPAQMRRQKRHFVTTKKWTELSIPIKFDWTELPTDPNEIEKWTNALRSGVKLIMDTTCVNFTFESPEQWDTGISIVDHGGCSSSLGQTSTTDWQHINLAKGCLEGGIVAHELMHALGLNHEHQRDDSRNFIKVNTLHNSYLNWESQLIAENVGQNLGYSYDFGSLMHYEGDFSNDPPYLIITHSRFYQHTIGQREKLSFKDAAIINKVYCAELCKNSKITCQNGGYANPRNCAECLCPEIYSGSKCESLAENKNCVDLMDYPRELKADWQTQQLKPVVKCLGGASECQCHWRIKPKTGQKLRIQLQKLNFTSECPMVCSSSSFVEINFRKDQRTRGARLCCPNDIVEENSQNWIYADQSDMNIVITATIDTGKEENKLFELSYETDEPKLVNSNECFELIPNTDRNPGKKWHCYNSTAKTYLPCCSDPSGKCPLKRNRNRSGYNCQVVMLNGQYKEVRGQDASKKAFFYCYKREGVDDSKSFWVYWMDKSKDPIFVDDFQCLFYYEVDIKNPPSETIITHPLTFKSIV